jgi:hypothetical protein
VGAVACAVLLTALLAACGRGDVEIDSPSLSGKDATGCSGLVDNLPDKVADQSRRPVTPEGAYGAAWGDDPIVLRCGVPKPKGFDKFATCQVANGVAWFIPMDEMTGHPRDLVMTTVGFAQNVEVRLPAAYWPPATAMADLAHAVKKSLREVKPCV